MKQHLVIPGRSSKMSLNQNNSRKLFISVESLFKTCNWQNALFVSGSHRSDTSRAWSDCQHPSALWMSRSANAAERRRLPERRIDANICGGSWAVLTLLLLQTWRATFNIFIWAAETRTQGEDSRLNKYIRINKLLTKKGSLEPWWRLRVSFYFEKFKKYTQLILNR